MNMVTSDQHQQGKTSFLRSDLQRELVDTLKGNNINISPAAAEWFVVNFFDTLADSLASGKRIEFRGFGVLEVRLYGAYMGRNPKTEKAVAVQEKFRPFWRTGKTLLQMLNSEATQQD